MSDVSPPTTRPLRLREIFDRLIDLDPTARAARLAELALPPEVERQVLALLEANPAGAAILDHPASDALADWRVQRGSAEQWLGARVGGFKLIALIGEGGTSVVFRAERAVGTATQIVALKMLRTGLFSAEAQRRFAREQSILAQLTHPHIARLIEGGVADNGAPYIAMEYIDGQPITRHADARALDLNARLRLFVTLCRAVDAAHAALVVHRDLKPSNVFVDAHGEVKVLDFGIAKILDEQQDAPTRTQAIMLTPQYAAPEQFHSGSVTTAADVYALGVILGELLTGELLGHAQTRSASEVAATRADRAPPRGLPGRTLLARYLRGDLDAIVATALEEDPQRRYRSASALADDIERHLAGQPVTAHPPSRWYRARKFIARHRGGVALTSLLAIGVLASLGLALWQARVARIEAERANTVRDLLVDVFDTAKAGLPRSRRPSPDDLIQASIQRVRADATLDAVTRAQLLDALGRVSASNGNYPLALQLLDESLALDRATSGESTARVADTEFVKAQVLYEQGQHQQALDLIEPRLPALRAKPTPRAPEIFALAAELEVYVGDTEKSLAYARECAALGPRVFAADTTDALTAQLVPGLMLGHANRLQESVDALEPVIARWKALGLTRTREFADALSTLASSKHALGDMATAERYTREGLEVDRAILQAPHDALADDLNNLGALLSSVRRFDEAEAPLQEALAMRRALFGDDHVDVVRSLNTLANNRNAQGQFDEAIALLEQAHDVCTRLSARNEYCAQTYSQLGSTLTSMGRYQEALSNNTLAVEWRKALSGEKSQAYATALSGRAATHINLGHLDEGERDCRQALTIYGEIGMGDSLQAASSRQWCARASLDRGDFATALADAHQSAELWQAQGMSRQPSRLIDLRSIEVRALQGLGRGDEARELARATLTVADGIERVPPKTLEVLHAAAGTRAK